MISQSRKQRMQQIHDLTADEGAKCYGRRTGSIDPVQVIHDLTLGSGAACAMYRPGVGKLGEQRPGQLYEAGSARAPAYRSFAPGMYAALGSEAPSDPAAATFDLDQRREAERLRAENLQLRLSLGKPPLDSDEQAHLEAFVEKTNALARGAREQKEAGKV
jgi:hypothetical protein